MATAAEEKEPPTATTTIEPTMTTTDPWLLFLYALRAPSTKEKYIQRLVKFLDFLGYSNFHKLEFYYEPY